MINKSGTWELTLRSKDKNVIGVSMDGNFSLRSQINLLEWSLLEKNYVEKPAVLLF